MVTARAVFCSIFALVLPVLPVGCRSGAARGASASGSESESTTEQVPESTFAEEQTVATPDSDGVLVLPLTDGRGEAIIRKAAGQVVSVSFPTDGYARLHASIALKEPAEGNLRISTITFPDGSTDGPFGRSVDYDLPAGGGAVGLRIGESSMQGDAWAGDFVLTVELTK